MLWCFGSVALLFTLLALAALTARPPSLPRPMRLLRGCAAILCLLIALGVAALAFIVQR
jgi:hypothetical protein